MSGWFSVRNVAIVALLLALLLLPVYVELAGNRFLLTLFTRILILAMAAVSLNLILGYGGMMSFGHAAYLGIGGYAVGMLAHEGIIRGFVQWPVALAGPALFALVIGALSLRTRGVYFIMITLAFAQMAYYVVAGLRAMAATTGSPSTSAASSLRRSICPTRCILLYLPRAALCGDLSGLADRRFALWDGDSGRALERYAHARHRLPDLRYKLVCFVIAGTMCGLAGALLANHTDFVARR